MGLRAGAPGQPAHRPQGRSSPPALRRCSGVSFILSSRPTSGVSGSPNDCELLRRGARSSRSTGPITTASTGSPRATTACCSSGWCSRSTRPGLSWLTILNKRAAFRKAYRGVRYRHGRGLRRPRREAAPGRCRHHPQSPQGRGGDRECPAACRRSRDAHGSFAAWLDRHHPLSKPQWVKLFKETFRFTGGEIVGEFLMSLGYLAGAHVPRCPVYTQIVARSAVEAVPWRRAKARADTSLGRTRKKIGKTAAGLAEFLPYRLPVFEASASSPQPPLRRHSSPNLGQAQFYCVSDRPVGSLRKIGACRHAVSAHLSHSFAAILLLRQYPVANDEEQRPVLTIAGFASAKRPESSFTAA